MQGVFAGINKEICGGFGGLWSNDRSIYSDLSSLQWTVLCSGGDILGGVAASIEIVLSFDRYLAWWSRVKVNDTG